MSVEQDGSPNRLTGIHLDESARIRLSPQLEHERRAALFDLMEANQFELKSGAAGPYVLNLRFDGQRLTFDVRDETDRPIEKFVLPLVGLRRVIKDYFLVCDSYFKSIRTATPSRIEAIDMGRRGLHNEGAELLISRLADRVDMDLDTARRLFTLICLLHIRV